MNESWYLEQWPDQNNTSGITRLELITGWPSGIDSSVKDIDDLGPDGEPVAALERALLPALTSSHCCVAFSGGRDSSVLLALATRVARREGLPDPVPLTMRFGSAASQESDWQMVVIKHLGLRDWTVVEQTEELDLVGTEAGEMLRTHGLQYPASAHAYQPLLRAAAGGALVHGDGGDQVFDGWARKFVGDLLSRRRTLRRRDWRMLIRAFGPKPVRRAIERSRASIPAPWLDPSAGMAWRRQEAEALASEPRTWPAFLRWVRRERMSNLTLRTLERLGSGSATTFHAPFWDPGFLVSLGDWGGRFGGGSRTALMLALFGGLLPEDVARRQTKAHFSHVFFSEPTRRFASQWTGPPPEPAVVRTQPLREAWLSDLPPTTCALLLQACWLAGQLPQEDRKAPGSG